MINLSIPEIEILVDSIDIKNDVAECTLQWPQQRIDSAYIAEAVITIVVAVDSDRNFYDHRINPQRWAWGQKVEIKIKGVLFSTLRISSYSYYDGKAELNCTDLLGLLDFERPAQFIKGVDFLSPKPWPEVVKLCIKQSAEIGDQTIPITFDFPVIQQPMIFPVEINQGDQVSLISYAQSIAGERGYWLWCKPDETITLCEYPLTQKDPAYSLPLNLCFVYEPNRQNRHPYQIYKVSSVYNDYNTCLFENNQTSKQYAYDKDGRKFLAGEVETVRQSRATLAVWTTEVDFPFSFSGSYLTDGKKTTWKSLVDLPGVGQQYVTSRYLEERWVYYSNGLLRAYGYLEKQPIFQIAPVLGTANTTMVLSETFQELWEYDPFWVVKEIISTTSQPLYRTYADQKMRADKIAVVERREQKWQSDNFPPCNGYEYSTVVYKQRGLIKEDLIYLADEDPIPMATVDGNLLVPGQDYGGEIVGLTWYNRQALNLIFDPDTPKPEVGVQPPSPPTYTPPFPGVERIAEGQASFEFNGQIPFIYREAPLYTAKTLRSDDECVKLANLLGTIEHQSYYAFTIGHEIISQWQPFQVVNIHDSSWIVTSPAFILSESRAVWSFTGLFLGLIIPAIEPVKYSTILPSTALAIQEIKPFTVMVGSTVTVNLFAVGGTQPYTFSSASLPSGLTISGDAIVGTPTTAGVFAITVTVQDASSNSDSFTTTLTVLSKVQVSPFKPVSKLVADWVVNVNSVLDIPQTKLISNLVANWIVKANYIYPFVSQAMTANWQVTASMNTVITGTYLVQEFGVGLTHAFSIRKISSLTSNILEARNTSTNSIQTIGLTGDDLNESALSSFASGSNLTVYRWFDQSGFNNHAVNSTAAIHEPFIYSGGQTEKEGSRAAIRFNSANNTHLFFPLFQATQFSIFVVARTDRDSQIVSNNTDNFQFRLSNSGMLLYGPVFANSNNISTVHSQRHLYEVHWDGNMVSFFYDNSPAGTHVQPSSPPFKFNALGTLFIYQLPLNGTMQEVLLYNVNKISERALIASKINSYFGIF